MKNKLLFLAMGLALSTQMILAQVPSYVPSDGLMGYWPFNGDAKDQSGNGNNGIVDGATLTTDRFGNANKAYSFNGINNYITATRIYQSAFSVSLWFNTSGSQLYNPLIDAFDANWEIQLKNDSPDYVSFITASNYQELLSSSLTQNNIWYNLICTYSNNVVKFYINGILKDQFTAYALPNNIGNYYFGASMTGADQFFNGDLDDIGIWNRALTQDEITSLYYAENTCQSLVIHTGVLSFNPPTYQNTVTIYPNPANDQITIDCGTLANVTGWKVKISNALGQEVFTGAMNTQQHVVPLNSWGGQGIYFVKIYDASNNLMNTKKIILQ